MGPSLEARSFLLLLVLCTIEAMSSSKYGWALFQRTWNFNSVKTDALEMKLDFDSFKKTLVLVATSPRKRAYRLFVWWPRELLNSPGQSRLHWNSNCSNFYAPSGSISLLRPLDIGCFDHVKRALWSITSKPNACRHQPYIRTWIFRNVPKCLWILSPKEYLK